MGQKCLALGTVLFLGITNALPARAQLLVIPDVNKLCQSAAAETHRNTIVYVDLSSIKKGVDEWGYTILRKLQLTPREHLTVLGVDPTSFEVLEVFDSCYPILSPNEITQIRNKRSWWEHSNAIICRPSIRGCGLRLIGLKLKRANLLLGSDATFWARLPLIRTDLQNAMHIIE